MSRDQASSLAEQTLSGPERLEFAGFVLDRAAETLTGRQGPIMLAPLPFRLLAHLVAHPGRLITREELWREVWQGRHVEFDASLSTAIRKVRIALGDTDPDHRLIESVPRRGYRLTAQVRPIPSVPNRRPRRLAIAAGMAVVALGGVLTLAVAAVNRDGRIPIVVEMELAGGPGDTAAFIGEAENALRQQPGLRITDGADDAAVLRLALSRDGNMLEASLVLPDENQPFWRARLPVPGNGIGPDPMQGVRDVASEAARLLPQLRAGSTGERTASAVVVERTTR